MPIYHVVTFTYDPERPWVVDTEESSTVEADDINEATELAGRGLPANQRAVIVRVED